MKLNKFAVGLAAVAITCSAHAAPITGDIKLSTTAGSTVVVDFGLNLVDFTPNVLNTQVDTVSGTAAVLAPVSTLITYKDFIYPQLGGGAINVIGGNPIWSTATGSLAFSITQISTVLETVVGGFEGLTLFGSGFFTSTTAGFDPTLATWSFGANRASGVGTFSFSSTAAVQPGRVPDGGTSAALLGASLLGLAGLSRKLRKL